MLKRILIFGLIFAFLASCAPAQPAATPTPPATVTPTPVVATKWWKDDVFYEIFVRSFYDSNGDGIGDINGITQKLDYLNDGNPSTNTDLGVTGIWLMPIFPSPSYHGYDVTDYYSINPQYGTMDDFKKLVAEAHKRGIKVIIDLVINHTSDQHPWFKAAKRDPNSPYRNWYIWSATNPGYKGPWNETVWHSSTSGFYYGIFEPFMPDLNYSNPEVTAEMTKVYSFWLKDVGIDGFRLDAAKHLIEQGPLQENTTATHKWYQAMYPVYKAMNPNAMTIGELNGDNVTIQSKYVEHKEFDLTFNFELAATLVESAQTGKLNITPDVIALSNKYMPDFAYSPFLTNHDQNRVMDQLGNDVNKAKIAAALLLTSPGTPFIYYGEELGMNGSKPDPNIRRPMQWNAEKNAGFTTGKPWEALDTNIATVNVQKESADPQSLLSLYRSLLQVRNNHSSLRDGQYYIVDSGTQDVYAALRMNKEETVLVLINLSDQPISDYGLTLKDAGLTDGTYKAETLFGAGQVEGGALSVSKGPQVTGGNFQNYKPVKELAPYSTLIVKFTP